MYSEKESRAALLKISDEIKGFISNADNEGRELSEEEIAKVLTLQISADEIQQNSAIKEQQAKLEAKLSQVTPTKLGREDVLPQADATVNVVGKLEVFKDKDVAHRVAKSATAFCYAKSNAGQVADEYCRDNGIQRFGATQTGDTGSAGGFTVPTELSSSFWEYQQEHGVFSQYADTHEMTSSSQQVPKFLSGLDVFAVAEGVAATESSIVIDEIALTAKTWQVTSSISRELNDDSSVNWVDKLFKNMGLRFARTYDNIGWNGDGTAAFGGTKGIVWRFEDDTEAALIAKSIHTLDAGKLSTSDITSTDVRTMQAMLPPEYEDGAAWFCSKANFVNIFGRFMESGLGNTTQDLGSGPVRQWDGIPIVITNLMDSDTGQTAKTVKLMLGNLAAAAAFGVRSKLELDVNPYIYGDQRKIGVFGFSRVAINVHELGDATNAGPMIALKTPAV